MIKWAAIAVLVVPVSVLVFVMDISSPEYGFSFHNPFRSVFGKTSAFNFLKYCFNINQPE